MASSNQSDRAYDEIRRRILILDIRPDERLKEGEWSLKLGVGRLVVREALTRLHGEGLVARGAKGGFFAAPMTQADVVEIREVREILEVAALRLAGTRVSAEALQEMETTCDDFANMITKGYHTGACEADRRFHRLLVIASGNTRLLRAYEHCHIPLFQSRLGQAREYIDDFTETNREHREIVAALRHKDVEKAIELLRAHFARGTSIVLGHLSKVAESPLLEAISV